jgi:hypothetical protein
MEIVREAEGAKEARTRMAENEGRREEAGVAAAPARLAWPVQNAREEVVVI